MQIKELLVAILLFVFLGGYMYLDYDNHRVVRYDCGLAEISPDYPLAVKEECRKKNIKKY